MVEKARAGRAKPLAPEQFDKAAKIVAQRDFKWWFDKTKIAEAAQEVSLGIGAKVSRKDFDALVEQHCEWYRKRRRYKPCRTISVGHNRWEKIRRAVEHCMPMLQGRPIEQAVAIVSYYCPVNESLLRGLTIPVRPWDEVAKSGNVAT